MIVVDTWVIVAWLDETHEDHQTCLENLGYWAGNEELAVSSMT